MLATLGGFLALLLGLLLLLLPLLVPELSRPRDSVWGAVVLLLGLVLVTSAERLTGAPMLAVLCGGLLVGRLGTEVAQGRWRVLTEEERRALLSSERWSRSLHQLGASTASLLESALGVASTLGSWAAERRQGRVRGKRWVRSEPPVAPAEPTPEEASAGEPSESIAPASVQEAAAVPGAEGAATVPGPPAGASDAGSDGDGDGAAPVTGAGGVFHAAGPPEPAAAVPISEPDPAGARTTAPAAPNGEGETAAQGDPPVTVVPDFTAIDALLAQASPAGADPIDAGPAPAPGEGADVAPAGPVPAEDGGPVDASGSGA